MAKAEYQNFIQQWNKTVTWAKQNSIPYQAYYPIYQEDSKRLVTNQFPMSEAERYRAIEASAGINYSTALPTDQHSPTDIIGNVKSNAQSIFTGLSGFVTGQAEANLWDTVKNAVQHPATVYGPILHPGMANANLYKQPNDIWNFVPGVQVFSEMLTPEGRKQAETNPLSSLLDIAPLTHESTALLARTSRGAAIADQLGISSEELSKLGAARLSWRVLRSKPLPFSAIKDETGKVIKYRFPNWETDANHEIIGIRSMTVGERIDATRGFLGISKAQGDIVQNTLFRLEDGGKLLAQRYGPAVEAVGALSPEENALLNKLFYSTEGVPRPRDQVLNDPQMTPAMHDALEKVYSANDLHKQILMQRGALQHVTTPFGEELYTTRPGDSGPRVLAAKNDVETKETALNRAAEPYDALLYKVQMMDNAISPQFATMQQMRTSINNLVLQSAPELYAWLQKAQFDPDKLNPEDYATYDLISRDLVSKNKVRRENAVKRMDAFKRKHERSSREIIKDQTLIKNLLGLKPEDQLTLHHLNAVRDLIMPGGLIDNMEKAYKDQDFVALSKYSGLISRKFANKVFENIPQSGRAVLMRLKVVTESLHSYAVQREKDTNLITRMFNGTRHGEVMSSKKVRANSIAALTQQLAQAHQKFLEVAIKNPPAVWRNFGLDIKDREIMNNEHSAQLVDDATAHMKKIGYGESEVDKMHQDPRTILEIMDRQAKNAFENNMMPSIPYGLSRIMTDNMYHELASLRARGTTPEYAFSLSAKDIEHGVAPTYNITLSNLAPKRVSATMDRIYDYTPLVNDIQMSVLQAGKDLITSDVRNQIMDDVKPRLLKAADAQAMMDRYLSADYAAQASKNLELGYRQVTTPAILQKAIKKMGWVSFDQDSVFGPGSNMPRLDGEYYIHESELKALTQSVQKFSLPAQGFLDRATRVFRFSILAVSPRYTAHIVFGGTFLMALRAHPSIVTHLNEARYLAYSGDPSPMRRFISENWEASRHERMMAGKERVLAKYPHAELAIGSAATQEGMADIYWHMAGGHQMAQWTIESWLAKRGLPHTWANHVRAAAALNMKFTRTVVHMQRSMVYLDGAARALKTGYFWDDEIIPQLDARGKPIINEVTGKQQYTKQRVKVEMTAEEAHKIGMESMAKVMGELRHMTPIERNGFQKMFPFYGWTKHILTYVLTYPLDHPYRALFLTQLAEQNSQDVASGLPLRIQLLLFLGNPDEYGNVSTVDVRAFNPLRDTANYASTQGFLQSLNPVFTALPAYVDPQIIYGSNTLYPNTSYNALYGITTAGAQGNLWTAAEQFVPQLTAADAAFSLSGQYSYLRQNDPAGFEKKVFESLNIPFLPQVKNVRQIAAKDELDRYFQAAKDAKEAMLTGDFSTIDKYPVDAQLPDPMNVQYNITPQYLEALYNYSMAKTGLNPLEALPSLPNPKP